MLWACQITSAKSSCRLPKSICIHCVPLRRKMMLCSEAALSPSVSLARSATVTLRSLEVILLPGARFFTPARTVIDSRGLSGNGSTLGPTCKSLGIPLKAGAGRSNKRLFGSSWVGSNGCFVGATIQSNRILTSSPVLIIPRAVVGAGGSILHDVILQEGAPETLTFPSPNGITSPDRVISFVTPATVNSPRESNSYWRPSLMLVAPLRISSVERYDILGYCFSLKLPYMISSILSLYGRPSFSTLLSERTWMNTSAGA